MPGLRIGLQTVAVSNGYDPSFQQHAKFGPVIKIKSKVVWITHALKIIRTTRTQRVLNNLTSSLEENGK